MSLAPEECGRRIVKDPNDLKSTGNKNKGAEATGKTCSLDGTIGVHHAQASDSSLRSNCQQVNQLFDKPADEAINEIDEVPANFQHLICDNNQGMCFIQVKVSSPDQAHVSVQEPTSLCDAPANKPSPLHESSSGVATSGLSTTVALSTLKSTSLLTFDAQYNDQDFSNSTEIGWNTLQGPNRLQPSGDMPSNLWFDSIPDTLPQDGYQDMNPAFDPSSFLLDPLPNSDSQGLYLPRMYSSSLLPPDIIPIGGSNPPPSVPLPGAIVPHVAPPLASIPAQEYPLNMASVSIQSPDILLLGFLDGKANEAAADEGRGGDSLQGDSGNKNRGGGKRKADSDLEGMEDSGVSKTGTKHAKHTGEMSEPGQDATEATTEETEADRLAKEAKDAQEAAVEAVKAARAAAKAAKAAKGAKAVKGAKGAREATKPEQARRSGRVPTLPDHLKKAGYTQPKRNSRAKKSI